METEGQTLRLSKDVVPKVYDVTLKPDLINLTFAGSVKILISVKSSTKVVNLNAVDICVTSASLEDLCTQAVINPHTSLSSREEKITFSFENSLEPGDYFLKISYTGHINDQLRGFYRNKYVTPDGIVRYAAVTHFEATGARRAYPCWDEPSFKAKFNFTVIAPKDHVVLSNMPVLTEERATDDPEKKVVSFQTTPIMSTYLTAFVVGEYDYVESKMANDILVRVYTPLGKKEQGTFALEVATKSLSYYEEYFGVPYGLPKLDLITLTEFPIGAMENWGLVTFRETALLVDLEKSSTFARQYVSLLVTHELSHNWFGNLVTMNWWSDLWLKEGFATWIEYQCTDYIYPEFHIWSTFIKREQAAALGLDALDNSHPVQATVHDPGQIDEIFDAISYCKGASLIRMLQAYIGKQAFQEGMHLYLTRHAFSNTDTKDMWAAMTEASGKDVTLLMDAWTKQMGFPLLKVEEIVTPNCNQRKVTLTQTKFSASGSSIITETAQSLWPIPYAITTATSPTQPMAEGLMQGQSLELTIDCPPGDWIKVNPKQFMYYHVQYQPESLHRMVPAIEGRTLAIEDRIGLVTDLWALSKATDIRLVDFLELSKSFKAENDFAVVGNLVSALRQMTPLIQAIYQEQDDDKPDQLHDFKNFMCKTFRPMLNFTGWNPTPGEVPTTKLLREQVLILLGKCGDPDVKAEALKRFQDHVTGAQILPTDIRTPVYVTSLLYGDSSIYDKLQLLYSKEDSHEEKIRILRMIGSTPYKNQVENALKFSLSNEVRNQDTIYVIASATGSTEGRQLVWDFVRANWKELHQRYGTSTIISSLVGVVLDDLYSAVHRKEVEEFFNDHDAKGAEAAVRQGLEQMQANHRFVESQEEEVVKYLHQQVGTA